MSTAVIERPLIRRVSWGALFAGFFVGLGIWLMLLLLITAVGLSSVDPRNLNSWADAAQGVGLWGGIAGIVAIFCGAWCAGRLCGTSERNEGLLHGATVWGLTLVVVLWTAASLIGSAVRGAASVAGGAASAIGSAAPAAAGAVSPQALSSAATAGVNDYLRSQGRAPLPQQQLQAAMSDVASQALQRARGGNLSNAVDRQMVVNALARNTNLSPPEADAVAARVQQDLQNALSQAGQTASGAAGQIGEAAATGGRAAAWGTFAFTVLTLIAAILGGGLAITDRQRRRVAAREVLIPGGPLRPQEA